jgi:hypothetical protein
MGTIGSWLAVFCPASFVPSIMAPECPNPVRQFNTLIHTVADLRAQSPIGIFEFPNFTRVLTP